MAIRFVNSKASLVLFFLALAGLFGCASDSSKQDRVEVDAKDIVVDDDVKSGVQTARQIFYSLPSPLETAMILKRSGAEYNPEILNPVENISRYTTSKSMALNLGIYSTNLSYASLFDQTQASIKYMTASKKMAEGLGILNAIDNTVIQRLEENVNNRDVIMEIISETFLNTNSILEENDRVAIGSIILVGGWLEGLYIATSLVDDISSADNELVDRIIDQKLSMSTVIRLLEQHNDNADVRDVLKDIKELNTIYDKIQVSVSQVEVVTDNSTTTTLRSKNVVSVNPAVFNELKDKVIEIRTKYIM
ncbi:MAG TPA: hypothetical protein PLV65_00945 [Tenuifilaceae bacterium]|nr:hypothetical protein [Tenuifilaceae bacterium]